MKGTAIFLIIVFLYFFLQLYLLPKMGISTWLRNACQVAGKTDKKIQETSYEVSESTLPVIQEKGLIQDWSTRDRMPWLKFVDFSCERRSHIHRTTVQPNSFQASYASVMTSPTLAYFWTDGRYTRGSIFSWSGLPSVKQSLNLNPAWVDPQARLWTCMLTVEIWFFGHEWKLPLGYLSFKGQNMPFPPDRTCLETAYARAFHAGFRLNS